MKNITLAQALVLAVCVAAPIAAYKLLGSEEAAAATMIGGMVVNFMLGRPHEEPKPPSQLNGAGQ
jgi:hypothetical protein